MSNKPKILVSADWMSGGLAQWLKDMDIEIINGPEHAGAGPAVYEQKDWQELFGDVSVALVSPITLVSKQMMQAAPKLRAIISPVIGVESIDVDAATELGILVGHGATPENFLGMAEATVLFIAALAMQMPFKQRLLAENQPRPGRLTARSVRGRTVGLIGMGRIAQGVVSRLQGWETEILYYDPYVPQADAPAGVQSVSLEDLLTESDFVSVHVTVTDETQAMISEKELRMMKPTAYLVNTARGAALDEDAVYRALTDGVIAGAALDTFVEEPLPADSPMRELVGRDNVILTPHIIGHSHDVMASLPIAARENVGRVLRGEPPLYIKNPQALDAWQARMKAMH